MKTRCDKRRKEGREERAGRSDEQRRKLERRVGKKEKRTLALSAQLAEVTQGSRVVHANECLLSSHRIASHASGLCESATRS